MPLNRKETAMQTPTPGNLIILEDEAIVAEEVTPNPVNSDSVHVTYRNRGGILKVTEIDLQESRAVIIPNPSKQTLDAYHRQEHQARAINKHLQYIRGADLAGITPRLYEALCAIPKVTLNDKQSAINLLSRLEAIEGELLEGSNWLNNKVEQYITALATLKEPTGRYSNLIIPGVKKNYAREMGRGKFYATYRYNRATAYFQVTDITAEHVSIKLSDGREGHLKTPYRNAVVTGDAQYPIDAIVPVPIISFKQVQAYMDGMKAQEQYRIEVAKLYRATFEGRTPPAYSHKALTCITTGHGYTPYKMRESLAHHIGAVIHDTDLTLYRLESVIRLTRQFINKYAQQGAASKPVSR